jgi:hypothetical protein
MLRKLILIAGLLIALNAAHAAESVGGPNAFSFVALGDMPYDVPADYGRFERLIAAINALKPAFSIHVGDIKDSGSVCSDERLKKSYDLFQTFEEPLIYSIGDNEWTDCYRSRTKPFDDPRERLAKLREMFFANPEQSLGRNPMPVESQAQAMPEHAKYVENLRFTKNGVLVVSIHVPGSNNGFEARDPAAVAEYFERNRANLAWIDDSFRKASADGAKAVVLAFQANLHETRRSLGGISPASGFLDTMNAIEKGATAFGKAVLIIHGDHHVFEVDGFRNARDQYVPNVWRLQVMGEHFVHAVRVIVDPDSAGVFGFVPLIVPENGKF